MKKMLVTLVVGFGLISANIAFAAVERPDGLSLALGEKSASQMNGRMLACGRPARSKNSDRPKSVVSRVTRSAGSSAATTAR